jgi:VanZ family protein
MSACPMVPLAFRKHTGVMSARFPSLLSNPRFRRLCRLAAALMYLTILVSGSIPGARADIGQYASGVLLHSTAYSILACLCYLGATGSPARRALAAVLTIALVGAGDEFVQSFFPYRTAAVGDWAVDVAAAAVTSAVLSIVLRRDVAAAES